MSPDPNDEPKTIFEYERRLRSKLDEPDGSQIGGPQYPRLPVNSPWGDGPRPGDEPPCDRREDGDVTGVPIDQQ
jgi:hypothetical protein